MYKTTDLAFLVHCKRMHIVFTTYWFRHTQHSQHQREAFWKAFHTPCLPIFSRSLHHRWIVINFPCLFFWREDQHFFAPFSLSGRQISSTSSRAATITTQFESVLHLWPPKLRHNYVTSSRHATRTVRSCLHIVNSKISSFPQPFLWNYRHLAIEASTICSPPQFGATS